MSQLDPMLLDLLVCPNCHADVALDSSTGAETLLCTGCGYRYRIDDNIPIMLIDEAEKPA